MEEVISFIVGILLVAGAFVFAVGSSILVSEKKARQRAGITDYYDQPIKKENEQN
jgi:hypothetical protein